MANPEQGPQEQGIIGQWQTVTLEAPDFLEPVRDGIDAIFSVVITVLNALVEILDVLKVFATGLLDPLITAIEELRQLIEDLLNDLRQAGVYIHGDFYSLNGPDFQDLQGGFLQYERRMLNRLVNPNDPNRPNISSNSTVLAVFLYAGSDVRGINNIVELIQQIMRLFNRKPPVPRTVGAVYNVQASYGYDGATIFSYNKGFFRGFRRESPDDNPQNPYNAVNLTWEMAPLPGGTFPNVPILPPAGFLVEFSTVRQELPLFFERPLPNTLENLELLSNPAKRETGQCVNEAGDLIGLTGGIDQIEVQSGMQFNDAVNSVTGNQKPDAVRVYAVKSLADPSPIQIDQLQDGDNYYLQRSFFIPLAQNVFFPGKGYGATFQFEDMPFTAEWELDNGEVKRINDTQRPERFFVRVRAVTNSIKSTESFKYLADQTAVRDEDGPELPLTNAPDITLGDRGPASDIAEILFPDASTQQYLFAVTNALAILALSRSDLSVFFGANGALNFPPLAGDKTLADTIPIAWDDFQDQARLETTLEDIASFLMPKIVGRRQVKKFFTQANTPPAKFRRKLLQNCINLTNRLYTQNDPPLFARQFAVSQAEDLINFKIQFTETGFTTTVDPDAEGLSISELLAQDTESQGIAPNPTSLGITDGRSATRALVATASTETLPRLPHFFFAGSFSDSTTGRGSADTSPVLYVRQNNFIQQMAFIRNEVPESVYEGCLAVLQLAVGPAVSPQERGWIAFRLFPQGIPSIDRYFDQILALLRSIQAAIESIAETIVRYIEYLQSRINELQAFLNKINALIQRLLRFFFSVSPTAGLILVAPGTEGIIAGLQSAENKPIEPIPRERDSYGGGVVLLAGGIPNIALDVFRALFSGDT